LSDGTQCNQVYIHNGVTQNHNRHLSKKHGITGVFSEKILSKKLDESHQLLPYEAQKERIKEKLDRFEYISITTDMWSSKYQKKSYGGFTAHNLDMNMKPVSVKLGINELSCYLINMNRRITLSMNLNA